MIGRKPYIRYFIFLITVFICLTNCKGKETQTETPKLPKKAGGLRLVKTVQGVMANKFMYQMHGKVIGTHTSIIGYYGNNDKENVLYVSSFENHENAEKALIRMASKINNNSAGFTPTAADQTNKGVVYRTNGMGLKHFFYRSGKFLVWWQTNSGKAEVSFQDLYTFKFGE